MAPHEDANDDDQVLQSSQARERHHFLVGGSLRFRAHPQLERSGALRFSVLLRPLLDVDWQPGFLDWSRRRRWRTIHPREVVARMGKDHPGHSLSVSVLLCLQLRPLEHPARRFDTFDAA